MTTKHPEALRLADILQHQIPSIECLEKSAAELCRLHAEAEANAHTFDELMERIDALIGALRAEAEHKGPGRAPEFQEALAAYEGACLGNRPVCDWRNNADGVGSTCQRCGACVPF